MRCKISDDIIVSGLQEGSESFFRLLYEQYYGSLVILAKRYLQNSTDCEDCVQTVFMRIWINHKTFAIEQSLSSYLFTAVKNECLNQIAKNKRVVNTDFLTFVANKYDGLNPESLLELRQMENQIKTLLNELPPRANKAFRLNRFSGKTYREIAGLLGVSVKTIEADISKALNHLKEFIIYLLVFINCLLIG